MLSDLANCPIMFTQSIHGSFHEENYSLVVERKKKNKKNLDYNTM